MRPMHDAMVTLFEHAKDRLTDQELESLANLTELARDEARRMSVVVEGLACLIADDDAVGTFHDRGDVFKLLCSLSHSLDTIAAMTYAGEWAAYHGNERRSGKDRRKGGRRNTDRAPMPEHHQEDGQQQERQP